MPISSKRGDVPGGEPAPAQAPEPDSGNDYEVGYGRPPVATRFRKGSSGNPGGRPKGSRNIASILKCELDRKIVVKEGGRPCKRTKREVLIAQQVNAAAKGDTRSAHAVLELIEKTEGFTCAHRVIATTDFD
jgi:hypothetical protein